MANSEKQSLLDELETARNGWLDDAFYKNLGEAEREGYELALGRLKAWIVFWHEERAIENLRKAIFKK